MCLGNRRHAAAAADGHEDGPHTRNKKPRARGEWVKRLLTSYREMMQSTAGFRRGQCVRVPISGEEMMFLRINSCETTSSQRAIFRV